MRSRVGGPDASPTEKTREGGSHVPIRAERSTLDSHTLPLSRNETIVTTMGKPIPVAHTARAVKQTRKRDTVAERHFQSNPSHCTSWHVIGHTVSYEINTLLLQYALNRLNILLILAGNADITLDLAVTVLKNFELKRDTIQTKNDMPAR